MNYCWSCKPGLSVVKGGPSAFGWEGVWLFGCLALTAEGSPKCLGGTSPGMQREAGMAPAWQNPLSGSRRKWLLSHCSVGGVQDLLPPGFLCNSASCL